MKKTKIGLTGLGRIGKAHLKNLVYRLPEAEVVAVSDISPEAKEIANQFGISTFYDPPPSRVSSTLSPGREISALPARRVWP